SVGPEYEPLPRSALLSSVVALLGVVVTDTAVRRLDKSGYSLSPFKSWILGTTGLLPAWLITLWILFCTTFVYEVTFLKPYHRESVSVCKDTSVLPSQF